MGARKAEGDYIVFVTQDAEPRNRHWLENLVKPLSNPAIAGSFSRQIARDEAVPMEKFFYHKAYPNKSISIDNRNATSCDVLFSNASAAVRRGFMLEHPFAEDILMSEDREWALRVIREGFIIHYEASSEVTHSHDTSFKKLFKRYFDFGVSHKEIDSKVRGNSFLKKGFIQLVES